MSAEKPRERPILFNDQMVRAILEGRKTVTRRAVKDTGFYAIDAAIHGNEVALREREALSTRCPFGQLGDRLWVRETWGLQVRSYGGGAGEFIVYRATNPDAIYCRSSEGREYPVKWKPSIHMHRHSSRILLEITAVRVERLQDISEEQAEAEGTQGCVPYCQSPYDSDGAPACDCMNLTYKESFQALWSSINGVASWDANPWVWCIEFKRVTP
ncbi:hypothetical protein ACSEPM_08120 [Pseudomonas aeruginosa]|uniref:hypothetical protein n=1 Tax=Pseudomonas aeruginosa TaxID=287 RepID=UPI001ADF8722|nr:hypothetical protein [Pseudomonas aeruginosa]MBX5796009.1 hypothetical protein [Pseudomonas aeruginosa]MBZ5232236.1 hypothetical protein [Pseudomonas aeruginosa]MBZ5249723.1 hypothetical protein [Pseudomonas aeruginosa]MDU0705515.1 hypothetical protein [Pseudomonas aeruginosa]HBN8210043.1 hypothetical protein [Pseudomonas aeruginosa]